MYISKNYRNNEKAVAEVIIISNLKENRRITGTLK